MPTAENVFRVVEVNATLTFNERSGLVESIGLVQGPANLTLARVTPEAAAAAAAAPAAATAPPSAAAADGASGHGSSQLAGLSWRRRRRQRRRSARRDRVGRRDRQEHQVEDADPRHRDLESDRLGQSVFVTHRHQQGRRQDVSGPGSTAT